MLEYDYRIYGLRVRSQIPFPEAQPDRTGEAEVDIAFGNVPKFLREAGEKGMGTWTDGFVSAWFRARDGTQICVESGKKITVDLAPEPHMTLVNSLLLSAGMALICLQRGELFFHGSVLQRKEQAILLCGESGAGKSTAAMELLQRGAGFLADDTVRVHPGQREMLAEPSYPQQKLCRDMARRCGKPLEELRYIDEDRDKYAWIRRDCYGKQAVPLKKVFLLRKAQEGENEQVKLRKVIGGEALETMCAQLYLADTYRHITGIPYPLMEQLIRVVSRADIYEVTRPATGDTIRDVVEKILQFC